MSERERKVNAMADQKLTFDEWWGQLRDLFRKHTDWCPEDSSPWVEFYNDGMDPDDTFSTEISYWDYDPYGSV